MENENKNFIAEEQNPVETTEAESENVEISVTAEAEQIEAKTVDSEERGIAVEVPCEVVGVREKEITDYRTYVRETVERQIDKYEKNKIETCSKQEIFNDAFECNAYIMIADALLDDNVEDEMYEALANEGDDILDNMFLEYFGTLDASIRCNEETIAFLRKYCKTAYPEIMNRSSHKLTI